MTNLKKLQQLAAQVVKLAAKPYDAETCDADNAEFERVAKKLAQTILELGRKAKP